MDRDGWPGWRSKSGHRRYVPERAGAFLAGIHRIAPEIRVIPWTGGNPVQPEASSHPICRKRRRANLPPISCTSVNKLLVHLIRGKSWKRSRRTGQDFPRGVLGSDVRLEDEGQRKAFAEHARRLVELGADGVQLNVEPLPSGTEAFLSLLREVKAWPSTPPSPPMSANGRCMAGYGAGRRAFLRRRRTRAIPPNSPATGLNSYLG